MTAEIAALADRIDAELAAAGTPERAVKERAYLRSELRHHGTSVPAVRRIATTAARHHPEFGHDQVVELVELLWASGIHEQRVCVVDLLGIYIDRLVPEDAALLERLLRDSRTWALVDGLCISVMGPLVEDHDELGEVLDRWSVDDDVWLRRAALLSLLVPLRNGEGDVERFFRCAESMLDEREFFVAKAIGWVLRDTAKRRPELVYEWLLPRASRASAVTIREAVKYLSEEQRAAILAAR